jgi:hypothetical protein
VFFGITLRKTVKGGFFAFLTGKGNQANKGNYKILRHIIIPFQKKRRFVSKVYANVVLDIH